MSQTMIFNCTEHERRIAILENSVLTKLYIERAEERSIVGNIYVGKVIRVLPGMQAAFVDIGLDRSAFLYVSDVSYDYEGLEVMMDEDNEMVGYQGKALQRESLFSIDDILKEGQEVMAQVSREPIGTKGARITTHISLPGRNLVLMPTLSHIGISRKIVDEDERRRLQFIIERLIPEGFGAIARTVSEGKEEEELGGDVDYLLRLWEKIRRNKKHTGVPALVHKDLGITLRAMRDFYTREVEKIVIDSVDEYHRIKEFMETFIPGVRCAIEHHAHQGPIFDYYDIEFDIRRALNKHVWLKSGGYIVIEETEALCSIDVNTGKYVGKRNLEETILKTNLEAVKEIAYQLKLRNIGGIIIIDFIDMENEMNRDKVYNALREELEKDKNKTNIQKISELGLIEMTRQRTGKSLEKILCEPCPYCEGMGLIKSKTTVCYDIFRELRRTAAAGTGKTLCLMVNPDVANILYEDETHTIERLEKDLGKKIQLKVDTSFHQDRFDIIVLQ